MACAALGALVYPSSIRAQAAANSPTTAPAFRPDLNGPPPLAPSRGTLRAYAISSPDQFVPGQLADAYFGDFVLENDAIKVVIARPEKKGLGGISGGSIIDVSRQTRPLDYINSIQTIPDLYTTGSAIRYEYADTPAVDHGTTGMVVLHGKATVGTTNDPGSVELDVLTTYSLPKNSNVMQIHTEFRNPESTQTAALLPGDTADWGEATTFVEGIGIPSGNITTSTFVLGFASEYSVGLIGSGPERFKGFHTKRDSVLPAYEASQATTDSLRGPSKPPVRSPSQRATEATGERSDINKSPLEILQERIQRGEVVKLNETEYALAASLSTETLALLTKGTTETQTADEPDTASRKLTLSPGKAFAFIRYLVVSDADFSRIVDFAYNEKLIETGYLAGAVLEAETDQPIAGADVYISGGPHWSGTVTSPAYYKVRTRSDGTFACRLPAGKYIAIPGKIGRMSLSENTILEVKAGPRPQLLALVLSRESVVRVAVSQAETPTSSPLPCKLTFIEKQGTAPIDWGDGPRGDRGVRNTFYLPYGWGNIPVTPGRYQVFVSRGVEYDIVRQDVSITPGGQAILKIALPHALKGRVHGMYSVDAGLITSASAVGAAPVEDRVMQAVCEGVHVIVSGDYNRATDFQPTIDQLGLSNWIRSARGMRLLLHKGEESAEVLVYPLTADQATSLTNFLPQIQDTPPDLALADLRKAFPGVLLEIARPADPERGYFHRYGFDTVTRRFTDTNLPPPDYDSIQIYEGKKLGLEQINYPRYSDLQVLRTNDPLAKVAPLSPVAYSASSLPFAQEIGYPRVYLHTNKSTLKELQDSDIVQRIRGQHYTVTNGPIVNVEAQSLPGGSFDKRPGDVIDLSTTRILRLQMRVLAPSWVSFSGWAMHENGLIQVSTPAVRPVDDVQRYPVLGGQDITTRYLDIDTILDGVSYGANRSLAPIVSDALPDFGGPVHPYGFTGPIFVDKENDGKIRLTPPQILPTGRDSQPARPDPSITE